MKERSSSARTFGEKRFTGPALFVIVGMRSAGRMSHCHVVWGSAEWLR